MKIQICPARAVATCLPIVGGLFLSACSTPAEAEGPSHRNLHFDALDADQDGSLSYGEFLKSKWGHDSKSPRVVFKRLDTNKNGTISHIELQEYLRRKSE